MQSQLSKYKESASDIHSLRADVHSISSNLDRKVGVCLHELYFLAAQNHSSSLMFVSELQVKECDALSVRSADQLAEINRLLAVVCYLFVEKYSYTDFWFFKLACPIFILL
jgi:E3 ubiquitin-protein ligase BRE1